jgi:glycosyltransferase involved in cell wall biosynthesis
LKFLKKVIIISYFYPPSNFVGSDRVAFWAENLNKHDIYPIVITRQWNEGQKDIVDKVIDNELKVEQRDGYEIHRLPFRYSLRDKLAAKKGFSILQKFLTLTELIFSRLFINALPYGNFYKYADDYIKKNHNVEKVLISARPFFTFFIGWKLKKANPSIEWIADYRDDWTTGMSYKPIGFINHVIHQLDIPFEKLWLSNAKFIISASEKVAEAISNQVNRPGFAILNGYTKLIEKKKANETASMSSQLKILYAGTLYGNQKIEVLFQAIEKIGSGVEVCFVGADVIPSEWARLQELAKKYSFLQFLPRLSKELLNIEMEKADIFFTTAYEGMGGFVPVKCFDYLSWEKPVLLCPSDGDEIESFVSSTNSGVAANSVEECKVILVDWVQRKINGETILFKRNQEEQLKYSRAYQTEKLAQLILEN